MSKNLSNWRWFQLGLVVEKFFFYTWGRIKRPYGTNDQWNIKKNLWFILYYQVIYSPSFRVQQMNKKFASRLWRNPSKGKTQLCSVSLKPCQENRCCAVEWAKKKLQWTNWMGEQDVEKELLTGLFLQRIGQCLFRYFVFIGTWKLLNGRGWMCLRFASDCCVCKLRIIMHVADQLSMRLTWSVQNIIS